MTLRFAVFGLAAMLLSACSSLQAEDAATVLKQGGAGIASVKTVIATMKITQGTISFQGFSLVSATASIRLPDESDTIYTVRQQDIQLALQVVITGGRYFLKPPLLAFSELTPAQAVDIPDLARLFDPATGLAVVIPAGTGAKYLGIEAVDNVDSYKVSATYTGAQIKNVLPQLASEGDVSATVWVGGTDHLIRKAVLAGTFGDKGTPSVVEVDLSGFNGSVTITSPSPVASATA